MKICWATIRVADMDASLKFYHEVLGLPVDMRHQGPGADIVMLGESDQPKIELLKTPNQPQTNAGTTLSIGFEVDSLDNTLQMLKDKGVAIASDPVSPNPFTSFFFVNDPDGVSVQFVEQKHL